MFLLSARQRSGVPARRQVGEAAGGSGDPAESCISVSSALKNRSSSVVGHQDCTFRE